MDKFSGLDLNSEEYQLRLDEYKERLVKSINTSRRVILNHIRQTFGVGTGQRQLRELSWTFSEFCFDHNFYDKVRLIFKPVNIPVQIGKSPQDAYHQTHIVNAFLLGLLAPETKNFVTKSTMGVHNTCVPYVDDEAAALELQERFYIHLTEKIKKEEYTLQYKTPKRITLESLNRKLNKIISLLTTQEK